MTQLNQYAEKIYIVGDIPDPMASQTGEIETSSASQSPFNSVFANRVKYDGQSTDAPIFIMAEEMEDIDGSLQKSLRAAYDNQKPIAVIRGKEHFINRLLQILGIEQRHRSPVGIAFPEIFVVDKDRGSDFRWVLYSSAQFGQNGAEGNLTTEESNNIILLFRDWIANQKSRSTGKVAADKREAIQALKVATGSTSEEQDLEAVVRGFSFVQNIPDGKNYYQLSYWIYAVHDFKDNADWYYVRQEGQLSASGNYSTYEVHGYMDQGYTVRQNYMYAYTMDNCFLRPKASEVQTFRTSPSTETSKKEVTSEIGWDFSGDLGFEGKNPAGNVGASLHLSNSSTVVVTDCDVFNQSVGEGQNAKWLYQFKEVSPDVKFAYVHFSDPSPLQVGLLQPVNKWLWRVDGKVRERKWRHEFFSRFTWESSTSLGDIITWWHQSTYKYDHCHGLLDFFVPLRLPPRLMVDQNWSIDKKGQSKAMDIAVGSEWKVSSDQSWCRPEPSISTAKNKRVNVTVDENTTGNSRTATLTFSIYEGDGIFSATTQVFQSQY
jgi:hypothetical protein